MIYLIIGNKALLDKEIENIIKSSLIAKECIIKYDLSATSFFNVLETLDTVDMFNNKKLIVCQNISLIDQEERLLSYLKNPSENILILTNEEKLNEKKEVFKSIKKYVTYIEPNNNFYDYIKLKFQGYQIDTRAIRTLEEYVNKDYNRLNNEIEKLKQYKIDSKIIDIKDIEELVKKENNNTIFNLIDAIINNKKKAFQIYNNLIENSEDEIKILNMLAINYRLILQTKLLIKTHSEKEIAEILKAKPYSISKALEKSYSYTEKDLVKIIMSLAETDLKIKTSEVDKKIILPILLSKL